MEKNEAMKLLMRIHAVFPETKLFEKDKTGIITKESREILNIWAGSLMKYGDYEKTANKIEHYIVTQKFKPRLSDILAKKTKVLDNVKVDESETRAYRIAHDEQAKKKNDELRKRWAKIKESWENE